MGSVQRRTSWRQARPESRASLPEPRLRATGSGSGKRSGSVGGSSAVVWGSAKDSGSGMADVTSAGSPETD